MKKYLPLAVVISVTLLVGCTGPQMTLSNAGQIYWSNVESERAKMAKQRLKNEKAETKRLQGILKSLETQEKVQEGVIAEHAKQRAIREEIKRRLQ